MFLPFCFVFFLFVETKATAFTSFVHCSKQLLTRFDYGFNSRTLASSASKTPYSGRCIPAGMGDLCLTQRKWQEKSFGPKTVRKTLASIPVGVNQCKCLEINELAQK